MLTPTLSAPRQVILRVRCDSARRFATGRAGPVEFTVRPFPAVGPEQRARRRRLSPSARLWYPIRGSVYLLFGILPVPQLPRLWYPGYLDVALHPPPRSATMAAVSCSSVRQSNPPSRRFGFVARTAESSRLWRKLSLGERPQRPFSPDRSLRLQYKHGQFHSARPHPFSTCPRLDLRASAERTVGTCQSRQPHLSMAAKCHLWEWSRHTHDAYYDSRR